MYKKSSINTTFSFVSFPDFTYTFYKAQDFWDFSANWKKDKDGKNKNYHLFYGASALVLLDKSGIHEI